MTAQLVSFSTTAPSSSQQNLSQHNVNKHKWLQNMLLFLGSGSGWRGPDSEPESWNRPELRHNPKNQVYSGQNKHCIKTWNLGCNSGPTRIPVIRMLFMNVLVSRCNIIFLKSFE
jgi:hypothetical protein